VATTYSAVPTSSNFADSTLSRRGPGPRDRIVARAILGVVALAVAGLLSSRLGYIPMWDGFIYADAIQEAATGPFQAAELRLAGHASQAYAALAAAAHSVAPESFWPLLAVNALLFGVACVGFHRLLRLAFPDDERRVERALLTAAFALQPTLLASVVQPGLDLPLVPGFIWCVVFLLERRWVALVVVGVLLAFTKETGVLLYAALLGTYALWVLMRTPGRFRDRAVAVLRLAPLALPGIVFVLYLAWRKYSAPATEPVVWTAGTDMIGQSLLRQLLVPRIDRHLATYLAIVLVLNFAWVASALIAGGSIVTARRVARRGSWRGAWEEVRRLASTIPGFLVLLTLVTGYALTRFATYGNSRYLLPVISLLLVPAYAALLALPIRPLARRGILGLFIIALLVSSVRTVDPVSRALFGTFRFGEREMLRVTSITQECCGVGRDQLVYSLEFTMFDALTSDALAAMQPGDSTLFFLPDDMSWFFIERLDAATGRRTLRRQGTVTPKVAESDSTALYSGRQWPQAYFVALPNALPLPTTGLERIASAFVVGPERRFRRGGYSLSLYPLTSRPGRGEQTGTSP
jgi:hypothetical protein